MRALKALVFVTILPFVSLQIGCATSPDLPPAAREGLSDISASLENAGESVRSVVETLRKMESASGDAAAIIREYSDRVASMDRTLDATRSRLSTIRGPESFFESWKADIAAISDTQLRREGEDRYDAVRSELDRLNAKIDDLREAFAPMHRNITDLARYLKDDPTLAGLERSATTIRRTLGQHREVKAKFDDVQRMIANLM
jgi:chromosome segregation ATPase